MTMAEQVTAGDRTGHERTDDYLRVVGVTKQFPMTSGAVTALDNIDLRLPRGGFGALIGPSGCGKSTLLRLLADLLEPTSGEITIDGRPPAEARSAHRIGFVFQDPTLLPWRSVIDNVRLPIQISGKTGGFAGRSPAEPNRTP